MNENEDTKEVKTFPLYPYLLQGQQALPNCKPISVGRPGDARHMTPLLVFTVQDGLSECIMVTSEDKDQTSSICKSLKFHFSIYLKYSDMYSKCPKILNTLYSILSWPKFCFLCSCVIEYLVEWQTV